MSTFTTTSFCFIRWFSRIMTSTLFKISSCFTEIDRPGFCSPKSSLFCCFQPLISGPDIFRIHTTIIINCFIHLWIQTGVQRSNVKNYINDLTFIGNLDVVYMNHKRGYSIWSHKNYINDLSFIGNLDVVYMNHERGYSFWSHKNYINDLSFISNLDVVLMNHERGYSIWSHKNYIMTAAL